MKVFLRWELDYFLHILGYAPLAGDKTMALLNLANQNELDITVDEVRSVFTVNGKPVGPHPDSTYGQAIDLSQTVQANRGSAYLTATDVPESSDATIPTWATTNGYPLPPNTL